MDQRNNSNLLGLKEKWNFYLSYLKLGYTFKNSINFSIMLGFNHLVAFLTQWNNCFRLD